MKDNNDLIKVVKTFKKKKTLCFFQNLRTPSGDLVRVLTQAQFLLAFRGRVQILGVAM